MKMRWAWIVPVLSSLASTMVGSTCLGQIGPMPTPADPALAPMGPMPMNAGPIGTGAPYGPMPDAYGTYGQMPMDYGAYGGGYGGQMPMDPSMMGGMGGPPMGPGMGCPQCGGYGCDFCGGGMGGGMGGHGPHGLKNGLLGDILGIVGPYPDGGCAAVRWYDFAVDFMLLKREDAGRNIPFTSLGQAGPIVLETDDLDFNEEPSFRFSGLFQLGPAASLEFTYFGLFHYQDGAFVQSDADNLFSVVSDFGLNPAGGFLETDASDFQSINYTSTFDSFEINFRQRWMAPNCRYQGSWLVGVRHFILDEQLQYNTSASLGQPVGNPARAFFTVDTTNAMTGFQFGGDMWVCLLPGLRIGGELKAGVYGNHINSNTTIGVTTAPDDFLEELEEDDVAFVGQADLLATWRINYQWTLRTGYTFLYADGVALAPENFNTDPPFVTAVDERVPFVNDDGNVFYHGWFLGAEFMW
jgi:Putative beta barrel porin-7 (BBP7)